MTGDDLPSEEPVMPDEMLAKALWGNDMTDEQWSEHWKGIAPDAAGIFQRTVERLSRRRAHHLRQHD